MPRADAPGGARDIVVLLDRSYSMGYGDTWEYTAPPVGVPPGLNDRPWLAYTKGALYLYVNHGTHIAVYRSADGGRTWEESFSTLGRGQRYWTGHVSADRQTGSAYLFGANCELGPMCAAASHDDGQTWDSRAIVTTMPGPTTPVWSGRTGRDSAVVSVIAPTATMITRLRIPWPRSQDASGSLREHLPEDLHALPLGLHRRRDLHARCL